MDFLREEIFSKKNLIYLLIMAILILAIPLAVRFIRNEQATQLKSQAAGDEITFPGLPQPGGVPTTTDPNVKVRLNSPFGGPP